MQPSGPKPLLQNSLCKGDVAFSGGLEAYPVILELSWETSIVLWNESVLLTEEEIMLLA